MAKFMKRSIAMLLVLNMLTGMIPAQALAAEGDSGAKATVVVKSKSSSKSKSSKSKSSKSSSSKKSSSTKSSSKKTAAKLTASAGEPAPSSMEEPKFDSQLTTGEGINKVDQPVEENKVKDEFGNDVTTTSQTTTTDGTVDVGDGVLADIEGKETYTEIITTNPEGFELGSFWELDGSEKVEWTVEDLGNGPQTPVEVEIIPGKPTEGVAKTESSDITDELKKLGYDYIVITDRTVTVTPSEYEVTVNDAKDGLVGKEAEGLKGVLPVYDETDEIKYRTDGRIDDASGKDDVFDRNYLSGANSDPATWTDIPDGADLRYVGTGEHSKHWAAYVNVTYAKDKDGNTVYDENGKPVIEDIWIPSGAENYKNVLIDGEDATELVDGDHYSTYMASRASNFLLKDVNGNLVVGYCCDIETGANKGKYYTFTNLEDSDYYASEESEEHIRSICMNGYWGTSDIPDDEGNYELGSLEKIKQDLKNAIANGEMDQYYELQLHNSNGKAERDEEGNIKTEVVDMLEIIDGLTAGEALLATQAAIWSYANGHQNALNGIDGSVVVDAVSRGNFNPSKNENEPMDNDGGARVEFFYNWLIGLDSEEESTVVINDKNHFDDISLTVKDKAEGHSSNEDNDHTNDVYNTELSFTLAFIPGDKDDLLVQVSYKDLDGNEQKLVKRLAGSNGEGQSYDTIKPDQDGSYVIADIQLSENEDFNFDLRLEGMQYLEHGVYVYEAVGGRAQSQTMVGIAEGERNVDVSVGMTITFDVDENNHVVAERRWHSEKDPKRTPSDNPPPARYRLTQGVGQLEIIDEEVPLAEPPQTGDISMLWFAMIMMSGLGLCMLNLLEKKREEA